VTRGVNDLLADSAEAVDAAAELVNLGKQRWEIREQHIERIGVGIYSPWSQYRTSRLVEPRQEPSP